MNITSQDYPVDTVKTYQSGEVKNPYLEWNWGYPQTPQTQIY